MDHVEQPAEELVEDEREKADADHERDRQDRRRDPLLPSRPRDAPQLRDDAAEEVATRERLSRFLLLFVHQRFISEDWQGGQDSNLQQLVLETRTLPIELPPSIPIIGFRGAACGSGRSGNIC